MADTYFKPRFKRREDGGYDASYGKGKKKLTDAIHLDPETGEWFVEGLSTTSKKLRDVKEAWGEWAAEEYGKDETDDKPKGPPPPPSFTPSSGPPKVPPPPPVPSATAKPAGTSENIYVADMIGPKSQVFYDDAKNLTDLGALEEVWSWIESHIDRTQLGYPWESVRQRLAAAFPDDNRYQIPRKVER